MDVPASTSPGPAAAAESGGSAAAGRAPLVALLAVVTVFAVEGLRTSGPPLDHVAGAGGVAVAALVALLVYLIPVLVGPLVGWLGARRATSAAVLLLVGLRLLEQAVPTPGFGTALATTVVGLGALVLVSAQVVRIGRRGFALGIVLGGALDVAVRSAFGSWDPAWRPGLLPWLYTVVVCALLVVLLARTARTFAPAAGEVRSFAVLGPYLALYVLILGSPAFVASQGGLGAPWATVLLLFGVLLAIEAIGRDRRLPGRYLWIVGLVLLGAVAAALYLPGVPALIAVLVGQVAAALLLARLPAAYRPVGAPVEDDDARAATETHRPGSTVRPASTGSAARTSVRIERSTGPRTEAEPDGSSGGRRAEPGSGGSPGGRRADSGSGGSSSGRRVGVPGGGMRPRPRSSVPPTSPVRRRTPALGFAAAGLGAGLGFVLVVLLYQASYDLPLPFDNRFLPLAGAVLVALPAVLGYRSTVDTEPASPDRRGGLLAPLAGVPAVLLIVPVVLLLTTPAPAHPSATADSVRLVTWNLHYGVNDDAAVDPAAIAATLRSQHPDVIVLQEVNRGWPIGGGTDLAEWLSRALGMPYVWSPAADGQFGNVIMSSLPMSQVRTGPLPYGQGPQRRSYARATVQLPGGHGLTVCTAHLQNITEHHATRDAEIDTLLGHCAGHAPVVVAGDFNSMPGWPEIAKFDRAGLVSAQDSTGHAGELTSPTDTPKYRPDWIFGSDDVSFNDFRIVHSTASDHFPLATTVRLG
ncbi:endonuclease/exonuclease/phosphatase family protein [Actinocatenispora comari]|nr:endonuclease/exonuclease/phosphatase family protein [Actinocatenispora comari]